MNEKTKKILIADDEESIRFTFHSFLTEAGYQVETAHSLSSCISKMQAEPYDMLFLDVMLGIDNGIEAIERLKVMQPDCNIVVITGNPDVSALVKAKNRGALDYLSKPIRKASLMYHVEHALGPVAKTNQ
jgi:DNA-binding NtrC family response regulator